MTTPRPSLLESTGNGSCVGRGVDITLVREAATGFAHQSIFTTSVFDIRPFDPLRSVPLGRKLIDTWIQVGLI